MEYILPNKSPLFNTERNLNMAKRRFEERRSIPAIAREFRITEKTARDVLIQIAADLWEFWTIKTGGIKE